MLEKIGLPAKPSQRGNNWVVDASHCQGCSSQFTFINRKHHCRRCGGLFCNSCTQQRMVLRGQGDAPVRVCEPCKKLEEAARFELRYGRRNRAGKGTGSSRLVSKDEDEILNQIIGSDRKEYSSLGQESRNEVVSVGRASSSSSLSISQGFAALDGGGDLHFNEPDHGIGEEGSTSPQELRQRALEERKLYKVLKAEGKTSDALKAFKRGKELERQADALEISLRRNRRKGLSSDSSADIENKDGSKGSSRRGKLPSQVSKEKDDLFTELKELGWSDMDLHGDDKKSSNMTLEGELSSLIGDSSEGRDTNARNSGIDKTQVVAHKRKALALKREGKLTEAKEELKKAKVLEKQLEEQELLGAVEDSDDEISALIKSIDNDEQDDLLSGYDQQHDFDINQLMGTGDDVGGNLDVTDDDLMDPEIAATLKSMGWTDDSDGMETVVAQSNPVDRETLLREIHLLKREALNKKRAGNISEAMAMLKKAKLLEKNIESLPDKVGNLTRQNPSLSDENSTSQNANTKIDMGSTVAPKSRLVIQKELLAIKKKALSLRREGKVDEAEEELKKGKLLEQQLEGMDNTSKARTKHASLGNKEIDLGNEHPDMSGSHLTGEEEGDVTDQDMIDPAYLSVLRNLGWQDQDNEHKDPAPKLAKESGKLHGQETEFLSVSAAPSLPLRASRKSKAEIQRELLGLKRKALALRREGKSDEAEEVLRSAKELEDQMAEMEAPNKDIHIESKRSKDETIKPSNQIGADENDIEDVSEEDLHDPALLSMLNNLGWKDEQPEPVITEKPKSKGEIQRELLNLKRKALAHRRKGEVEEAEKLQEMAKGLEVQLETLQEVKKAPSSNTSKDRKSEDYDLGKQSVIDNLMDDSKKAASVMVGQNENLESFREIGRQNSDVVSPITNSVGSLNTEASHFIKDNSPLFGELVTFGQTESLGNRAANKNPGPVALHHGSINVVDFLTGDNWRNPELQSEGGDKTKKHLPEAHFEEKLRTSPPGSLENKEEKKDAKSEKRDVTADEKQNVVKTNSTSTSTSESKQHSPQQEVLAHKRKAVALKREGKLAEAREELRQAKLLEKSLEEVTPEVETSKEVSKSVSNSPPVQQKEVGASHLTRKPLSSRDRFKLQQESLSHKRQALKLRREGRMDEAEAEFELAKSLESQLEELGSQGSSNADETADGVVVEDLLDPQLLSALRAIGIGDTDIPSQVPAKSRPTKVSPSKNEAGSFNTSPVKSEAGSTRVSPVKNEPVNQERIQLEERIKAEKVKAVNLKRSGKQAEALDALRRAKLFEKKLNSLASN